jgi:hypothetical protein
VNARCTAFAAVTVDFPHCRVQFTIPPPPASQHQRLLFVRLEPQPLPRERHRIQTFRCFFPHGPVPK